MSKFQLKTRPATVAWPRSIEELAAGASLVQTQTDGRPVKPVRINFDLDPATHQRLKRRALDRHQAVAELVRELIVDELSK